MDSLVKTQEENMYLQGAQGRLFAFHRLLTSDLCKGWGATNYYAMLLQYRNLLSMFCSIYCGHSKNDEFNLPELLERNAADLSLCTLNSTCTEEAECDVTNHSRHTWHCVLSPVTVAGLCR